jgi:hypothetical protein
MDTTHPLVQEWARQKFGVPEGTHITFDQETVHHGYCETCDWTTEEWVAYVNGKQIGKIDNDLASLLNEVLTWAQGRMAK